METHLQKMDRYMRAVETGKRPAGMLERLAVMRHRWDLDTQDERDLYWSEVEAEAGCAFFPLILRHSKGEFANKPFELTDFQAFVLGSIHGWRRKSTICEAYPNGLRRFSRAHMETARKSGKSEFAAGLALQLGVHDSPLEPGAWINLCATKEDQVRTTTYKAVEGMVRSSPWLMGKMELRVKRMFVKDDDPDQPGSVITPVASDSATSDGFDTSGAILDELHAWARRHHELFQKCTTAGGSRRQELISIFTTAGNDQSELWISLRDQCVQILEAVPNREVVADHIFAMICCLDEGDEPLTLDPDSDEFETMMCKANPNYPVTPKLKYLKERAIEAHTDPLAVNGFMRFHANVRVKSSVQPFGNDEWKACSLPIDSTPEKTWFGLDLAQGRDFTSWAYVFKEDGQIRIGARSYTVEDRPKQLQTARIQKWIDDGFLIEHKGGEIDLRAVEQDLREAYKELNGCLITYDPSNAQQLARNLRDEFGEDNVVKFVQSYRYFNEPCRSLVSAFKRGEVAPDTDPCLRWQFVNLGFAQDNEDRYKPDKGVGNSYKIDSAVAAIMAYGAMILLDAPEKEWYYEDNDVGMY